MPPSSLQAVLTDEQLADFTELATRLERIFTGEAKDKESLSVSDSSRMYSDELTSCSVPSYLIDAFLRMETPVRAQHLQKVVDVLHRYEADIVQTLNTTSVRCLAYLLLNLDVESEQENGLNLLLVGLPMPLKSARSTMKLISAGRINLYCRGKKERV